MLNEEHHISSDHYIPVGWLNLETQGRGVVRIPGNMQDETLRTILNNV